MKLRSPHSSNTTWYKNYMYPLNHLVGVFKKTEPRKKTD